MNHKVPRSVTVLDSSDGSNTSAAVNEAFQQVITASIEQNLFHILAGKHSEPFAIIGANYPVQLERYAVSLFGLTSRGAHLICYVNRQDGMHLWIPRRAKHLYTAPGKLDTTVAGGIKAGASPQQTVVEEASEEASLPERFVRENMRSHGVMTSMGLTGPDFPGEKGLVTPDLNYLYDMELPADLVPKPNDDEVESFTLMSVKDVQAAMLSGEFKPGPAAVLVEFLIRHSFITPENEPDFVKISYHLHRRLPFRISPAFDGQQ